MYDAPWTTIMCALTTAYLSAGQPSCQPSVSREPWGDVYSTVYQRREPVTKYTLKNCHNTAVQITSYGAAILSIVTPDHLNQLDDIVLGFDDINGARNPENAYLGATIGRVANRIANGEFSLNVNGVTRIYQLDKNENAKHTLHGGFNNFGKVVWHDCSQYSDENSVVLCHFSPAGEGGFPGDVDASVTYRLNDSNALVVEYKATVRHEPTPISMTNHAYFNLAGHNAGAVELARHVVTINADSYTAVNNESIPTGEIVDVNGTEFDFRQWTTLGDAMANTKNGYDVNYALSCATPPTASDTLCLAAKVLHPTSRRLLTVWTTQPGLQFYTANSLSVRGRQKVLYDKHSAFCLEAQQYPDAVNHPQFPNIIIQPGETYAATTIYKFSFGRLVEH